MSQNEVKSRNVPHVEHTTNSAIAAKDTKYTKSNQAIEDTVTTNGTEDK